MQQNESINANYESSTFAPGTKMRVANYTDVEKAFAMWFHEAHAASVPISGPILLCHAVELATKLGHPQFTMFITWRSSMHASGIHAPLDTFKKQLKTLLLKEAFDWE